MRVRFVIGPRVLVGMAPPRAIVGSRWLGASDGVLVGSSLFPKYSGAVSLVGTSTTGKPHQGARGRAVGVSSGFVTRPFPEGLLALD